ncbi:MAG TPA: Fe(2+) transporter permease subunit FeoB [Spirochaetia bacterium]|nr:Fe(2+) transporter permease subunit FeoB [Spirochaetia bacterium]
MVAVAGNPNCGKTTIFNGLTGASQRIGNWPGVTVEKKEGVLQSANAPSGEAIRVVDLPGVYNLSAYSEDERAARDYLVSCEADLVLNVVDATNLERNLFLTLQIIEMEVPVVVVLTMMDLVTESGGEVSASALSAELGCPVIALTATEAADISSLRDTLVAWASATSFETALGRNAVACRYDAAIETVIDSWEAALLAAETQPQVSPRWLAVKLFEQDAWALEAVSELPAFSAATISAQVERLTQELGESPDVLVADARYGRISQLTATAIRRRRTKESRDDRVDRVLMHRIWGIPIFLAAMFAVFWVTINVGGVFIPFFDHLSAAIFVDGTAYLLALVHAPGWLITILSGGIGTGIETVATFIPVIFFMFLMLSLLEDSGYMARSAFVTDRFMGMIGLPGKAFVPLIVGFGCTVPAIMATRTLENRRDRVLTIFMAPLMSCGARLPVYALFAAAFFPAASGAIVFSLYLVGIVLSVLTGLLLRSSLFKGEQTHLLMELPPYHRPRIGSVLLYTWDRVKMFLLRAGKVVILGITILSFFNSLGLDGSFGNEGTDKSMLSAAGKAVTPIFAPMGIHADNWPATVAIFSGLFAKEAVVGTLTSLYTESGTSHAASDESSPPILAAGNFNILRSAGAALATIPAAVSSLAATFTDPLGMKEAQRQIAPGSAEKAGGGVYISLHRHFDQGAGQAYAYLLFILIYLPCLATLGTAMREIGPGYSIVMSAYLTLVAWSVATFAYQLLVGGSLLWISISVAAGLAIVFAFLTYGHIDRSRSAGRPQFGDAA